MWLRRAQRLRWSLVANVCSYSGMCTRFYFLWQLRLQLKNHCQAVLPKLLLQFVFLLYFCSNTTLMQTCGPTVAYFPHQFIQSNVSGPGMKVKYSLSIKSFIVLMSCSWVCMPAVWSWAVSVQFPAAAKYNPITVSRHNQQESFVPEGWTMNWYIIKRLHKAEGSCRFEWLFSLGS